MRLKFVVTTLERYACDPDTHEPGASARIKLTAVFDGEEHAILGKRTASAGGEITVLLRNTEAIAEFELGKPYYVDFAPAKD